MAKISDHRWMTQDSLTDVGSNLAAALDATALTPATVVTSGAVTVGGALAVTGALTSTGAVTGPGSTIHASTVAASAAIANTDTKVSNTVTVTPVTSLVAGSVIRVTAQGTCTSSNADTQVYTLRAGTAGTVADAAVSTATVTSAGSGTAVAFSATWTMIVRVPGASGTAAGSFVLNNTANTGVYADRSLVLATTSSTLATTTATKLTLSYISGASTTATTFQSVVIEVLT